MSQLYRAYAGDGQLLYVGVSFSALQRLAQHRSCSEWFDQCAEIKIERFEDRGAACRAEIEAIETEHPIFNIAHNRAANGLTVVERTRQAPLPKPLEQRARPAVSITNPSTPRLLCLEQVSELICFKRSKIYALIAQGRFPPPIKLDSASRWSEASIAEWVEQQKTLVAA